MHVRTMALLFTALGGLSVGWASAQADVEPGMELDIEPLTEPVKPLSEYANTTVTVRVSCALLANRSEAGANPVLEFRAKSAPEWATLTLSPARVVLRPEACDGGEVREEIRLIVGVSAEAPALTPAPALVEATLTGPAGTYTAASEVALQADYFSILDTRADAAIMTGKPGSHLLFPVTVQNLGNGNTKVVFETMGNTPGFTVATPAPVILESRQAGGRNTTATVMVAVELPGKFPYTNGVGSILVTAKGAYALDETVEGDDGQVSLVATSKGLHVPGPGLLAGLVVVGALARLREGKNRGD